MASLVRFSAVVALLSVTSLANAQEKPAPVQSEAAKNAQKKAAEWGDLASNLEAEVIRLLPCDKRVRTAIEEVSRASDARFAAITAYWQEIAKLSQVQVDASRKMIAEGDTRVAEWKADQTDSVQEQARQAAQGSDLAESVKQQAALANAARVLNRISQAAAAATKLAATREDESPKLDAGLNDFLTSAQSRQTAIENELKAIATEKARWSDYYGTLVTRSQMECAITGGAGLANSTPAPRAPARNGR